MTEAESRSPESSSLSSLLWIIDLRRFVDLRGLLGRLIADSVRCEVSLGQELCIGNVRDA